MKTFEPLELGLRFENLLADKLVSQDTSGKKTSAEDEGTD